MTLSYYEYGNNSRRRIKTNASEKKKEKKINALDSNEWEFSM